MPLTENSSAPRFSRPLANQPRPKPPKKKAPPRRVRPSPFKPCSRSAAALALLRRRRRRRRWRGRAGRRRIDHAAVRAGLSRGRRRWGRRRRHIGRRSLVPKAGAPADRQAEGPRLRQEHREELAAARILRIDEWSEGEPGGPWWSGRTAGLERRVERHLRVLGVEHVLRPDFDRPVAVVILEANP